MRVGVREREGTVPLSLSFVFHGVCVCVCVCFLNFRLRVKARTINSVEFMRRTPDRFHISTLLSLFFFFLGCIGSMFGVLYGLVHFSCFPPFQFLLL